MTITDLTLNRPGRVTTKEAWVLDGLCRDQAGPWDQDASPTQKAYAMNLCGQCPVRALCAEAGVGEKHGIWAGVDKGRAEKPVEYRKAGNRRPTKAQLALIAAVEQVLKVDGSSKDAAAATGKTVEAVRRSLKRADRFDLVERLDENRPEPPSKLKPRPLSLRQQRGLEFVTTISAMARRGDSMDDVTAHFSKSSNTIRQRLTTHKRRDLIDMLLDNRTRQNNRKKTTP